MSDITAGRIERMSDGPTMADLRGVRAVSSEVPALRKRISDLETQDAQLTAEKQSAEWERDEARERRKQGRLGGKALNSRNRTICMGSGSPCRRPRDYHGRPEDLRCAECRRKKEAQVDKH